MDRSSRYSYLALCIDTMENNIPKGRCYYQDFKSVYHFSSMEHFVLQADALLNGDALSSAEKSGDVLLNGKIATFKLRVPYHHNAGWQGTVMWLETRHEEHFRSVLELLSIVYQALAAAQKQRMTPSGLKIAK